MSAAATDADRKAAAALVAARPAWTGMAKAGSALGLGKTVFLHAGPAFAAPRAITRPILNSAAVAAVFEALAGDFDAAEKKILAGEIELRPAQDADTVTPLAAVVSPSMFVHVVEDKAAPGRRAYAPINGGNGPAPRLGIRSLAALDHLRWLHGPLAGLLLRSMAPAVDLIALAAEGLRGGDDCHGRTGAATAALARLIGPRFPASGEADRARAFLADSPMFFLNLWMAATKCMLKAAEGVAGSSLITAAGGNGAAVGIQLAGMQGRWFTAKAEPPNGALLSGFGPERRLGAIGDSAIVDVAGLGAMAMSYAPEQKKALGTFMPENGFDLPRLLLQAEHPGFGEFGLRLGVTARAVIAHGAAPVTSLGILDIKGEAGRIGGGLYQAPVAVFREALAALDGAPSS
jgi:hypothetical protein